MACAGAPSFDEPAGGCPIPLDQQTVAWGFVGTTLFLVAGGVSIFWLQRHDPLVSKRDWISTVCLIAVTLLTQLSVYFGASVPCWAYYALNYTLSATIPGLMMSRFFGIYARHLRQDAMCRAGLGSVFRRYAERGTVETKLDAPSHNVLSTVSSQPGPTHVPTAGPSETTPTKTLTVLDKYLVWMAYVLLLYRIDQPRRGIFGMLFTCIPWVAYAALRFASSPSHCLGSPGCQFDVVDVSMVVVISMLALSTAIPVVLRTSQIPDRLLLRYDGFAQLFIWPPLLAWLLSDLSLPAGSHTALHGIYGILTGCLITIIVSVWIPAVLSCCRRSSRTVLPRRLKVGAAASPRLAAIRAFSDALPSDSFASARGIERRIARSSSSPSTPRSPRLQLRGADEPAQLEQPQVVERHGVDLEHAAPQNAGIATHYSTVTNITSARQLSEQHAVVIEPDAPLEPDLPPHDVPEVEVAPPQITSIRDVSKSEMSALMRSACRFVHPAPSPAEVLATLYRHAADISRDTDSRELAIRCAVLFATELGRGLIFDTLRLDLSAELLGFLVDCENLRSIAEEWLPRVMIVAEDTPLPSGVTGEADSLCMQFCAALSGIQAQYIDFTAPHFISFSGQASSILRQAVREIAQLRHRVARKESAAELAIAAVAERAIVTLAYAELDVFEMVIDPLRRHMRIFPGLFDSWAAATIGRLRRRSEEGLVITVAT